MLKKILPLLLSLLAIVFLTTQTAKADKITIVSDSTYAPFEFKDSDHVYKGIDVDIIKKVAEISKWDYEMTFPGFDAAVNAVQAGQADAIMAGMSVTEDRKKVFTFSDTYYDSQIVIITTSKNKVTDYSQLKGKVVGVKNGTVSQTFLEKHKKEYGYTLKVFDTSDLMYNSLKSGSVFAVMDDKPIAQYAIKQGQDLRIEMGGETVGSYAFAVKKGSQYEYLINDFNKALSQMKEDGSYNAIIKQWTSIDTKANGVADKKAIPTKEVYKLVSDSSFAPFEYQNDSGQYVGIDIELIKAIANQQHFTIEVTHPGFDAALNAVQSGQADGVIAGMSITDEREAIFDFSDSYYTSNIILAVKEDSSITAYEDLAGKTVGAKTGTASYQFLEKHTKDYNYVLKAFDEASGMYDSLNSGSLDALMDDEAVLKYAIEQGRKFKTPIVGEPSGEYGFAVKKGSNPELIEMFNNGLAALKESGEYDKIIASYLGEKQSQESSVDETTIWGLVSNNYQQLLTGLMRTLGLAIISFAIAIIIGLIFGMMSVSPIKGLRIIASIFVDVVRGIPLMIVAAFIFWGIPNLIESITGQQSPINDFVAGTIALSLNGGAYISEIVRGGIEAVDPGQTEASRSLGVSYITTMRKIILPQAVKLMLPNFVNQFVISLKDTTIISAIGLVELFQTGKIIIARNYQSFRMYAILAIMYLVIITLLTKLAKRLEKRSN
ncbi:ABC transporter substrate-binding protein/permease [Streptococcus marimammalium]|uniref:ABC transporter substrate-binding protein/permease n=1 Tax=Streptococcus marimammalium TaxID=269666 RepID=UPI000363A31D|nr:ABC transporter substrate-binding protein/permease [Streptococcus marimammalium]